MGIKILFIAPYRGLKELATVLAKQQADLDIIIEEADLSAAIPIVKAYENKGIKFIISRGGTANLISKYTDIPVIEVKLSGYDILRTLTLIKDYQMKVQMIGFPNICNDVLSVSSLLNIDISYTIVDRKEEVATAVKAAWDQGAQLILGDTITVKTAEGFGLQGMMITTGKESVLEVFDQVKQMNQAMEQIEKDYSLYKELLHSINDGIAIFQEGGEIIYANQVFKQKLFDRNEESSIFNLPEEFLQLISELISKVDEDVISSTIALQGESLYVTAGKFIDRGNEYFYFKIHEINIEEKKSIEVHIGRMPRTSFAQIVTSSHVMRHVLEEARQASAHNDPLVIWGDKGVGKKFLASSIHTEGRWNEGSFVELIIETDSNKVVSEIANFLTMLEKTTVYVTGFEKITIEHQKEIAQLFEKNNQVRVIYSFTDDPKMHKELIKQVKRNHIYVPTLHERIEDLPELIRLFVSIFNAQFGKQIVGIKEDALVSLKSVKWTENVKQLKEVVKELVIRSEGDYIEKLLLDTVPLGKSKGDNGSFIDLTKTLAEIEKQIILTVLEEENMNQTKAAKRLGINRTTLWRKIN
ncbi:sigma-54-dependent Fis family transcriptional regulator [Halalkalibacter alkaliphilus]|uniref:PrpR N-terminal domain-containing protein n=1 Tax=Halalkalibacter alkaliphilus TaxID=2917993 RepID=A0A9X2CSM0_9BACI|nr:PrpR N-terminal domain-containing protein [Halalkalibacter alkaliphilus]MCL7747540.1 PrpR N-terminal domain-containing protein [Halalkalibacter alkaliphilus]